MKIYIVSMIPLLLMIIIAGSKKKGKKTKKQISKPVKQVYTIFVVLSVETYYKCIH